MDKEEYCRNIAGPGCGLKKVLNVIGGKWKPLILCLIDAKGPMRYNELRRQVKGITNTMLAQSLKEMELCGLVQRTQYPEIPVRVEYSLTQKTEKLIPILLELKGWGEKNL